ncbi:hypothetical protein FNO01nite_28060 [Flavobacterium noncentrifugens]|uniref:Por secretion system C-terminal sorting domain-containing protein n=1 Tax=Flavobacterium noncentrifugens TaxID=1128970 RepID=A0A1G9CS65_9FLAO|nr:GEVED domain-containing protein [Flavobacterium noncentrifugens]GEP52134.1 hypothetical protein FNO01nite_28060 [Flavobacterium noncentrifugens]SDK54478.1 Por secretion system C-terminal sorting domain-containing protein [Flavobacterium noncentrifugens]
MIINYNSLSRGRDAWLKNDVGEVIGSPPTSPTKVSRTSWLWNLLLVFAFTLSGGSIYAQTNIANYVFTSATGATYSPITGGTVFATAGYDDAVSGAITLGTAFPFGGGSITTCYINTNGYITFGAVSSSSNYAPLSTLIGTGAVSAFGQDAGASTATGAVPEIRYQDLGTEFVVQYKDHANFYNRTVEKLNFQIRLEYATGIIRIVYGTCTNPTGTSTSGINPQVGIRGNSIAYASNVNNLYILDAPTGTTCDWSNAVTGTSNSSTMLFAVSNANVKIPTGLSYTWTPPAAAVAPVRTFSATTAVTSSGATVAWTAPTGATQYNVQYRVRGTCAWTDWSANPVATNSVVLTGLTANTIYQVRVQSSNGSANSIYSHIPNLAGGGDGYNAAAGSFTTLQNACAGTPSGGTASPATSNVCSGLVPSVLTATGVSTGTTGLTYQWEESDDNGVADAWANAAGGSGATTVSYTPPALTVNRYYRLKVTCANGGAFAYSTVSAITVVNCAYDVTRSTGITYNSIISTGNAFTWNTAASTPATTSTLLTDDNTTTLVTMPFPFVYRGNTVAGFRANINGFVTLSSAALTTQSGASQDIGSTSTWRSVVAPFWDDLVIQGNPNLISALQGATAPIRYQVDGISPNRVLTVEWSNMEVYNNAGPSLNFQAKFYETSNNIEFVYGSMEGYNGTLNTTYSYASGLNGESIGTASVNNLTAQQITNTRSFAATAQNALVTPPECNTKITFTPGTYTTYVPVVLTPSNDEPGTAIALTVNSAPCGTLCGTYYNTTGATASAGIAVCSAATPGTPDDDVWFKFVATTAATKIQAFGGGGYNMVLQLFSDQGTTPLACSNATAVGLTETIDATTLTVGATYYIRVYHQASGNGTTPTLSICVSEVSLPPVNDNPCGAIALTPSTACNAYSDTTAAGTTNVVNATTTTTNGVVAPTCTGAGASVNDVWFKFTATSTTHGLTLTSVPGFDVAIQAFSVTSGTCAGNNLVLAPVGCINGGSTGANEGVIFTTVLGAEYYLRAYRHPSGIGGTPVNNSQFSICVFNPIPSCTTNSSPANLATGVSVTPTLTWGQVDYAETYDVYLGTTSGPTTLLATTTGPTAVSYTLTTAQTLLGLTQYYWYVVPKNLNGTPVCGAANQTSFTTLNSCLTPTLPTTTALGTTTATISWTAPSTAPANGYEYEVRLSGAAGSGNAGLQASGATAAGVTTQNIVGLTAQTTYTLFVRGVCGASIYSDWTTAYTFTTSCLPLTTLPHTESFDAEALPACWSTSLVSGSGAWAPALSNDGVVGPHTGTRFAGKAWVSGGGSSLLISPPYNLTATPSVDARVSVWIYRSANGLATDKVTFFVNNTASVTGATQLIDVALPFGSAPVVAAAGWYNYTASIPSSFIGNTFYVIAQGTTTSSINSYGLGFDDYTLEVAPPTIDSFTPSALCSQGSTSVTVSGHAFRNITAVKFNGVDAASYTVVNATTITAVAPLGVTAGNITVTSAIGTGTSTAYTVTPSPTVLPISGPDSVCLGSGTVTLTTDTPSGLGTWSSSNVDVATVSSSGVVTPVTEGNAVISFTVTSSGCTSAQTHAIAVNKPIEVLSSTATQTVQTGDDTFFAVTATGTGTPALSYQWQISIDEGISFEDVQNDATFSGATTSTLTITDVPDTLNNTAYQLIITGACGTVITDPSVLIVGETAIRTQPESETICSSGGGSASFTVVASPDVPADGYRWQQDPGGNQWEDITDTGIYSGSTTATLVLTGVTSAYNNYRYKVFVTGNGVAESNSALLTVAAPPVVNTNPTAQSVCYSGGSAIFTVAAGGGIGSYQWQYATTNSANDADWSSVTATVPAGATYSGAATASLTVNTTASTPANGTYFYRAVVNGITVNDETPCAAAKSAGAQLIINNVTINTQPAPTTIFSGNSGSFTVAATTTTAATYQWQFSTALAGPYANVADGTPANITYSGANTSALSVATAQQTAAGSTARYYRVLVSSGVGCSVASTGALLTTTTYCAPSFANGPGTTDGIANVSVGTLNNPSTHNSTSPYYTFFTGVNVPDLYTTTTVNVSVTYGSDSTQYGGVWIDFNHNGVFDASEGVVSTTSAGASGTAVFTFNVPAGAVLGNTRMRVRGGNDSALTTAQACGVGGGGYGEAEDYIVNILAIPACTGTPVAGTVTSSAAAVCGSGAVTLTAAGYSANAVGLSYQWYNTTTGLISGAVNPTYTTPVISTPTSYFYRVTCSGGSSADTPTITIGVNNPTVLTSNGATRCGAGTVNLTGTASAGATLNWFASASSGTVLGSGNTFATPSISTNTTYYVAAAMGGSSENVGKPSSLGTDGNTLFTGYGIVFNATSSLTLASAVIYPVGTGTITIALQNSAGTEIAVSSAIAVTGTGIATPVTLPLGFSVPVGTGYRLLVKATTGITGLIRDFSAAFPYTSTNASVTGGWAGSASTANYFIYNLGITTGCFSARTAVTATVNAAPALAISAATATLCNGNSTVVNVTSPTANFDTYTWAPAGGVSGTAATGFTFNPSATTAYTLTATNAAGCVNTATFNVTVNASPVTPVITPATATLCAGSIQALTIGNSSTANVLAVLGTGTTAPSTTSFPNPLSAYYGGVKHQMLYTAAELTAQGLQAGSSINSISLPMSAAVANACTNFTIRMGTTSNTALTGFVTGTSTVYGPATYTPPTAPGVAKFTLTTPYVWNGTSNLIVEMVHNAGNGGNGNGTRVLTTTTATNTVYYGASDDVSGGIAGFDALTVYDSEAASSSRPNTTFEAVNVLVPTWSPTTGLYTDAAASVPYTGGQRAVVYAKPTATTSYVATVSLGACPKASTASVITVNQFYNFYVDNDGDHYGTGNAVSLCAVNATTPPAGYASVAGDCNDAVAAINPGHAEVPFDGIDNNCDGNLDEGFQLKTKLLPSFCGATLTSIGSLIGIITLPTSNQITGYIVKVTNGANVQILNRPLPNFSLTMLTNYDYATTYTVEIQLVRNGVALGYYGDACFVSSPAVLDEGGATSVSPSQCGQRLTTITTLVSTTSLPGATGYRFRITDITPGGTGLVQTIDRPLQWFSLPMLAQYNYNATYSVEVAVKTTGAYSGYGSPCEVSTPLVTMTSCGVTAALGSTPISALSASGATQYRFIVTKMPENSATTIDRTTNYFTFNMIPGYVPGGRYSVRVATLTKDLFSVYSDACTVFAPGGAATKAEVEGVGESLSFNALAHPNPFASDFAISVTTPSSEQVHLKVYDMLGKLIESREVEVSDLEGQKVGARYAAGVYNVIVTQGTNVKTLRVIKR